MADRELIGSPPIPLPFLAAAKASFVVCWAFPAFHLLGWVTPSVEFTGMRVAGALMMLIGAGVAVAAMANLGGSLSVGLPGIPPGLRTGGVYRYSRHPIYLGALITCAGSCFVVPHLLNIFSFLSAVLLHSWIVRREERYLEQAYGDGWRAYALRVPRWAGPGRRPESA